MGTTGKSIVAVVLFAAAAATANAQQPAATEAPKVTDAEIAAIVVAANTIDAEIGDLAAKRASRPEIRLFGKTMGTDHRAVNQAAGELVAKLNVTPLENAISRQLKADATAFRAELEGKRGAAFDRAYLTREVAYHKAVIAAVDDVLLPNAQNAELKSTIASVRPALVAHLEHAEHLLAGLK